MQCSTQCLLFIPNKKKKKHATFFEILQNSLSHSEEKAVVIPRETSRSLIDLSHEQN